MKAFLLRWRAGIILTLALFAINVTAKIVDKAIPDTSEAQQDLFGWIFVGAMFLVFLGVALAWGRNRPGIQVAGDIGGPTAVACLLIMLVAPLVVGESPLEWGWGNFFANIWVVFGLAIAGAGLGMVALMAFGADYRSKQLKRFAERTKSQPKRV